MKHVLFAFNQSSNKSIENQILEKYKEVTQKEFSFNNEYYIAGIEKALEEERYDILVLREDLEGTRTVSIELLDRISDKYPELNIIFIVDDSHHDSNDLFIRRVFSLGIYNVLFKEDLTIGNIINLIDNPRKKLDAKMYLDIDENTEVDLNAFEDIPEDELITIFSNLKQATSENISDIFNELDRQYNNKQILYLISLMTEEMITLLDASNNKAFKKYYKKWDKSVSSTEKKESKQQKKESKEKVKIVEKIVEKEKIVEVEKVKVVKEVIEKEKIKKIYETPSDYKKKVGFVGHAGAGTTSLICLVGEILTKNKIKTAILDLTENRDLFEIYPFNSEENIEGKEALVYLAGGQIRPFKIRKYLDLYTASCDTKLNINNYFYIVQLLEQEYDVVLIDMDYKTPTIIYQALNFVYMLQTQNLSKVKHNTKHLLELKEEINLKKIKFIINQTLPCDMKIDDIIECLKVNSNFNTLEKRLIINGDVPVFLVTDEKLIKKMTYEMNFNIKELDEKVYKAIQDIARDIYPFTPEGECREGFIAKVKRKLGLKNNAKSEVVDIKKQELLDDINSSRESKNNIEESIGKESINSSQEKAEKEFLSIDEIEEIELDLEDETNE